MKTQYIMASLALAFFGWSSNLQAETSNKNVKLYVSVLDEDLNYVDGVKKDLVVEDVRGKAHAYTKADQKKEYNFTKGTSATFYVVKPSTSNAGYKKSADYNKVYLTRATTERDIVLLPKGTKKVSNATVLAAPVVGYVSKTSVEVSAQPFAGVDYKNRKDLSVQYQVVATNGKKSITKVSSSPKVTFNGLGKGAWTFKYYVRFVDKKGKRVAGTKHYSPTTKTYLGYDYNVVSEYSVLGKPSIEIERSIVNKLVPVPNGAKYPRRIANYTLTVTAPEYSKAIYNNKDADIKYHIDIYKTKKSATGDYTENAEVVKVAECEESTCTISAEPSSAYKAAYKLKLQAGTKSVYTKESTSKMKNTGVECVSGYKCPAIDPTLKPAHTANIFQPEGAKGALRVSLDGFEQNLNPDYLVRNVKTNAYTLFTNVLRGSNRGLLFSKVNNKVVVSYLQKEGNGSKEVQETFGKGDYEVQARYGSNYSWGGVAEFAIE